MKIKQFKPKSSFSTNKLLVWCAAFAFIGTATLLVTRAATPGCGLTGEAFCENFEENISTAGIRSGDLDPNKISAARMAGTQYSQGTNSANWVDKAQIPACRSGAVSNPLPPADTLICNPTSTINSRYGLTSAAVQNYGDNLYRINQPFDIAGRTGKIVFNANLDILGGLFGWPAITFTDEPVSASSIIDENGNGASPRNGLVIHFSENCTGDPDAKNTSFPRVRTYRAYDETLLSDEDGKSNSCTSGIHTSPGHLNHVEIRLSQTEVQIWASDYSADGVTFGAMRKMFGAPINLPFHQGWVAFGVHNHATLKYSQDSAFGPGYPVPSWTVLWDNIAFDGPVIAQPQVYEAQDSRIPRGTGEDLGYVFLNTTDPIMSPISFKNVQASGATSAQLTFNVYMEHYFNPGFATRTIYYHLNNSRDANNNLLWHPILMPADMAAKYEARGANRFNYVVDITNYRSELVGGDNTIQFAGGNLNTGYNPFVSNVDLLLNGSTTPPPPPTADTTPPLVTLTQPANNTSLAVGTNVAITANATDDTGVSKVEFYVDNTLKNTVTSFPYTYTLDTTNMTASSHTIFAKAFDAANNSAQSATNTLVLTIAPAPPPPTPITIDSSITSGDTLAGSVTWTATTSGTGIIKVEFYIDNVLKWTEASAPYQYNGDPDGKLDTATLSNGSHSFKALAYTSTGNVADISTATVQNGPTADTTAPSTPSNLAAKANSASQVGLTWQASTDNVGVAGYWISRNGVTITKTTGTGTTYTDSNVNPSTSYTYSVTAYDAAGNNSPASNNANVTTPAAADTAAPSVPANLIATAVSSSQINLAWTASTDNTGVTGYDVYRVLAAQPTKIATVTTTSLGDSGLTANTAYSYYVVARDAAGNSSANSATVSATTKPLAVTGSLTGTIKDAGGNAISRAQATIYFNGSRHVYGANSAGTYIASDIPAATYSVKYSAFHYKSQSLNVTIPAGGTATQNVTMVKR